METAIKDAVKLLSEKVTSDVKSEDAMRFTQAAQNLANCLATLDHIGSKPEVTSLKKEIAQLKSNAAALEESCENWQQDSASDKALIGCLKL